MMFNCQPWNKNWKFSRPFNLPVFVCRMMVSVKKISKCPRSASVCSMLAWWEVAINILRIISLKFSDIFALINFSNSIGYKLQTTYQFAGVYSSMDDWIGTKFSHTRPMNALHSLLNPLGDRHPLNGHRVSIERSSCHQVDSTRNATFWLANMITIFANSVLEGWTDPQCSCQPWVYRAISCLNVWRLERLLTENILILCKGIFAKDVVQMFLIHQQSKYIYSIWLVFNVSGYDKFHTAI